MPASAQPVGASVVAGQAQVLSSGANTIVNQNSAKAIINWQDFSVGQGASVQFNQPNSSAITLNRVTGSNLSNIDGAIRANGQVWLLNPNGVLFGNNARINVGGLLATTSDLANQDFLEGRYNFSGGGNGQIVNNGKIRAHSGGSVVLSGPRVTNRGLISARSGHVVLGGTDTFTVDFNGDRLLSYAVGASTQTGSVTNSGTVKAIGGQILMTARAASGVQDAVINNTGMAEATSAHSVNGEIILDAGEGAATNAGTINASGKNAGETGGTVKVLGRAVAVSDGAVVDVSGHAGGGTVMIGGNFQGKGSEQHAQTTTIGKASITADAIQTGNGGKVAVWSDGRTDFAGSITARGGANGGNGGQVETSGHDLGITASAFVSTLAPRGKSGMWLLDPHNINIVNGGGDPATGQTFGSAPMVDANIDPSAIATALGGGSVTLQAATDIIFQSVLTVTGGNGNTLTLQAGRSIDLGTVGLSYATGNVIMIANDPGGPPTGFRDAGAATITSGGGAITAARLDLIMSTGAVGTFGTIGTNVSPVVVSGATPTFVQTPSTDVYITTGIGGAFHFAIGNSAHTNGVDIGTGNLNLIVNGSQQTAPILANSVNVTRPTGLSSGNPIAWNNAGNVITGFLNIAAQGRDSGGANFVSVVNSAALTVGTVSVIRNTSGDTGAAGLVSFSSQAVGQDLTLTGVISTEDLVTLSAAGNIFRIGTPPVINAPRVSLNSSFGSVGTSSSPIQLAGLSGTLTLEAAASLTSGNVFINATNATSVGLGVGTGSGYGLKGNSVTLTIAAPTLIQASNVAPITANTLSITSTSSLTSGQLSLGLSPNVVGTATLLSNGFINFYNAGNLTINSIRGPTGTNASSSIDIQATGSITLATASSLSAPATLGSATIITLRAGGDIIQQNVGVAAAAPSVSMVSDSGVLGTLASPLNIGAGILAARTTNKDMSFSTGPFGTGTGLTIGTQTLNAAGLIAAVNVVGINAGTGNVQLIAPSTTAISSGTSGPITANNFRVTGASFSASAGNANIKAFSADMVGNIQLSNNGSFQINNLNGGVGIRATGASGNVNLSAQSGSITQAAGVAGSIISPSMFAGTVTTGNLILANPLNAVPSVTFNAVGAITFFNSVDTILNRASYNPSSAATAAQSVDIEVFGAGRTLTVGVSANAVNNISVFGSAVTLHSNGSIIFGGPGSIAGNSVALISDAGSIGAVATPIPLRGVGLLGARAAGSIFLIGNASLANNGVFIPTQLTIGSAANLGPGGGFINGITAGGMVGMLFGVYDVFGPATIKANALDIAGNSISLDDVVINTLSARSGPGGIDINSSASFQINNTFPNLASGILTSGAVSLTSNGTITQGSGAVGTIVAGSLSVFGVGGVKLDNSANAISGAVQLGSLGDALLVNSLATNVDVGLAGGTLTIVSGGDLTLLAGSSIATRSNGQGLNINDNIVLAASNFTNVKGILLSLKNGGDGIVLSTPGKFINNFGSAALVLPAGARFLVYSADPATDVFNGLRTPGQGVFGATYPTAVTATGNRYVFSVASSTITSFVGGDGLSQGSSTAAAPALAAFIVGLQPPPRNGNPAPNASANATGSATGGALAAPDAVRLNPLLPPPPPPPPPRNSPLADLAGPDSGNAEPPSSSDQATSYVVSSLDGGPPPVTGGSGGGTLIPRYLTAQPNLPSGTLEDPTQLPAFGNLSLWQ